MGFSTQKPKTRVWLLEKGGFLPALVCPRADQIKFNVVGPTFTVTLFTLHKVQRLSSEFYSRENRLARYVEFDHVHARHPTTITHHVKPVLCQRDTA
jgi:hypothetical protein